MAYVIAVCGSGGKTTLVKSLAKKYASENKKVCITTTTHMWYDEDVKSSFIIGSNANTVGAEANTGADTNTVGANANIVRAEIIRPIVGAKHCEPTHISLDKFLAESKFDSGKVYYIANLNQKKELITPLSDSDYKLICEEFDYVIIEADGSRSMPMKIPRMNDAGAASVDTVEASRVDFVGANTIRPIVGAKHCEPSIPSNVNKIIIVIGMEALGREIGSICHRFNEFYGKDKYLTDNNIRPETIVTEELLNDFVVHYYYEPLSKMFSNAKIGIYKNDLIIDSSEIMQNLNIGLKESTNTNGDKYITPIARVKYVSSKMNKFAIVLCASGFSKRFGSNKLMMNIGAKLCEPRGVNKKLYQLMIDKLLKSKEKIIENFNELNKKNNINLQLNNDEKNLQLNNVINNNELNKKHLDIDIAIVSQYEEILNDENYLDKVIMIKNENAKNGLSESIKLAVKYFKDYDAITFVNADLPFLPDSELANFIFNSILNKNGIAAMYSDDYKNPAYFEKKYFDDILKISGDRGPRELFDKYKMEVYKYYICDKYLVDIDSIDDLKNLREQ